MKFFIDTADLVEIRDLAATGLVDGVTTLEGDALGDGTITTWPVASKASVMAGRKYAKPPAALDRATATTAIVRMRKGLRRPCEARARWPGRLPSSTGVNSSPTGASSM